MKYIMSQVVIYINCGNGNSVVEIATITIVIEAIKFVEPLKEKAVMSKNEEDDRVECYLIQAGYFLLIPSH
jgi:hypothetical protein